MIKLIYTNRYPSPPSRLVTIKPKRGKASGAAYPLVYSASKEYVQKKDAFNWSPSFGLCMVFIKN